MMGLVKIIQECVLNRVPLPYVNSYIVEAVEREGLDALNQAEWSVGLYRGVSTSVWRTPLEAALEAERLDYFLLLLVRGADPTRAVNSLCSLIQMDAAQSYESVIDVLTTCSPSLPSGLHFTWLTKARRDQFLQEQREVYTRFFPQDKEHAERYAQCCMQVLERGTSFALSFGSHRLSFSKVETSKKTFPSSSPGLSLRQRRRTHVSTEEIDSDSAFDSNRMSWDEVLAAAESQRVIEEKRLANQRSEAQFLAQVHELLAIANFCEERHQIKSEILNLLIQIMLDKGVVLSESLHNDALRSAIFSQLDQVIMTLLSGVLSVDWNCVSAAIRHRCSTEVVVALLQRVDDAHHPQSNTALHEAAFYNRDELIRMLLDKGCPIAHRNAQHDTALDIAAREGHQTTCLALLSNGAVVDVAKVLGELTWETGPYQTGFFVAYGLHLIQRDQPDKFFEYVEQYHARLCALAPPSSLSEEQVRSILLPVFHHGGWMEQIIRCGHFHFLEKLTHFFLSHQLPFDYKNQIPFLHAQDATPVKLKVTFFNWVCTYYLEQGNRQGYVEWLYLFRDQERFHEAFYHQVEMNQQQIDQQAQQDIHFCHACCYDDLLPQKLLQGASRKKSAAVKLSPDETLGAYLIYQAMLTQYAHAQAVLDTFVAMRDVKSAQYESRTALVDQGAFSRPDPLPDLKSPGTTSPSVESTHNLLRHSHSDSVLANLRFSS